MYSKARETINIRDMEDGTPRILVQQGSNDSAAFGMNDAFTTAELARLTEERRSILRKTFTSIKTHFIQNTLTVFIRMFSEYPLYKDLWPQFRTIPDSSLMYSDELRKHAEVYGKGLNAIIDKLDNEIELGDVIRKMAKVHAKKQVFKNHIMNMLTEFLGVLKTTGVELDDSTTDAWTTLFDVIGNLVDALKPRST